jgi:hypothetical protein
MFEHRHQEMDVKQHKKQAENKGTNSTGSQQERKSSKRVEQILING